MKFPAKLLVLLASLVAVSHAEVREFTDLKDRKIKATIKAADAKTVTLTREDGKEFKMDRTSLSTYDQDYIAAWAALTGVKEEDGKMPPKDKAATAAAGSAPATWRITTKVSSGKKGEVSKVEEFDDRDQSIQVTVEVTNGESKRELYKAKGTLLVFSKQVDQAKFTILESKDEFEVNAAPLGKISFTQPNTLRFRYDDKAFAKYGSKYSGWLFVLKDETGKVIFKSSAPDAYSKVSDEMLESTVGDTFDKNLKNTKGTAPKNPSSPGN